MVIMHKQSFGRNAKPRKQILPVMLQNAKKERNLIGTTDNVPGDAWLKMHGINPLSVHARRIIKFGNKTCWLVVVR